MGGDENTCGAAGVGGFAPFVAQDWQRVRLLTTKKSRTGSSIGAIASFPEREFNGG
jgi:hypothetical protein